MLQDIFYDSMDDLLNEKAIDFSDLSLDQQEELFKVSKSHGVNHFVYNSLSQSTSGIDLSVMETFKGHYLKKSLKNQMYLLKLQGLFSEFESNDLQVMILKGISYLKYYENIKLRKMSDVDMLVDTKDILKVKKIIEAYGYDLINEDAKSHHLVFKRNGHITIELHTDIVGSKHPHLMPFKEHLWQVSKLETFQGITYVSPSPENEMIYCLLHMYKHYMGLGAGFKQLFDVYFIAKNAHLDWQWINDELRRLKLAKFTALTFRVLDEHTDLTLEHIVVDDDVFLEFKQHLFDSGAFGFYTRRYFLSSQLADYSLDNSHGQVSRLAYIFPSWQHMMKISRYDYCRHSKLLLPLAWLHRIGSNLRRGNISLKDNFVDDHLISSRIRIKKWITDYDI